MPSQVSAWKVNKFRWEATKAIQRNILFMFATSYINGSLDYCGAGAFKLTRLSDPSK